MAKSSRLDSTQEVLDSRAVGIILNVTPRHVIRLANLGILPYHRLNKRGSYRFFSKEIYAVQQARKSGPRVQLWDVDSEQMPERLLERCFGSRNWRYFCPDKKPESLLSGLMTQVEHDLSAQYRAKLREIATLKGHLTRLKKRLR